MKNLKRMTIWPENPENWTDEQWRYALSWWERIRAGADKTKDGKTYDQLDTTEKEFLEISIRAAKAKMSRNTVDMVKSVMELKEFRKKHKIR